MKRGSSFTENLKKASKSFAFGKRQAVITGLVVLIAVAGYINWTYSPEPSVPASSSPEEASPQPSAADQFASARLEREKSRGESLELYKGVLDNSSSDSNARTEANAAIIACGKAIEQESLIENLLKAKGFEQAVCYVREDSVNVIVKTEGLIPSQAAQIKDLAMEKTGLSADKVKIIETR